MSRQVVLNGQCSTEIACRIAATQIPQAKLSRKVLDRHYAGCNHFDKLISLCHHICRVSAMAAITVRNLPEETARALKARAAHSGRSTEAEVREILNAAVRPPVGIGTALAALGKRVGGVDLSRRRKRSPARAASFES